MIESEALNETDFVDFNSTEMQNAIISLIVNGDKINTAINIYNFVRDEILIGASPIGIKASETLKCKKGFSQMKGNLAIALFRGASIPARYRLIDFEEKKILGLVDTITFWAFPLLRSFMPQGKIIHVIPQIYLHDEWINVDPLFDIGFFNGMKKRNVKAVESISSLSWEGIGHISPQEDIIRSEVGIVYNADEILTKAAIFTNIFYRMGAYTFLDRHFRKLRSEGLVGH